MEHLFIPTKTIGMYCSDSEDLYNTSTLRAHVDEKYDGYLPIVNLFNINQTTEVRFTETSNKSAEVVTYNRGTSSNNLDEATVRSKRIDVTHNDLFMGPIRMVLNFTSRPITIGMPGELRKTFGKLTQDKFTEHAGKVLIFSVYTLNSPSFIYDVSGAGNYLETMGNYLSSKTGDSAVLMSTIYKYAELKWRTFKRQNNGLMPNSIKVICLQEIDEELLVKHKQLYMTGMDWTISNEDLLSLKDNPFTDLNHLGIKDLKNIYDKNSLLCYIVDNHDRISDRYMNVAGHVHKIPKIKNKTTVDGLYFLNVDSNGERNNGIICKLEDMDSSDYVYKTIEEANEGANVRQKYKDELELAKSTLEQIKINTSTENVIVKSEIEIDTLERKTAHEHVKLDIDLERERLKAELEFYKNAADRSTTTTKHRYESDKYQRDTFVETLKTVAAAAGLAATIFLVYKKVS